MRAWLAEKGISLSKANIEAVLRKSLRSMADGGQERAGGRMREAVAFSAKEGKGALGDRRQKALDYGRRVMESAKEWGKVVDDAVSGRTNPRAILRMGETPDMLVQFGLPNLPMVMDKSTLDKVTGVREKKGSIHHLTVDQVKDLYRHLADPVGFVRESKSSAVVLTEMDEGGKTVLVPVQVDTEAGNIRVNAIPSAFGSDNLSGWLRRQASDGKLVYLDKKRAATLKDMSDRQLFGVLQARLHSRKKLLTEGDVVKPVLEEKGDVNFSLRRDADEAPLSDYQRERIAWTGRKESAGDVLKSWTDDAHTAFVDERAPVHRMAKKAGGKDWRSGVRRSPPPPLHPCRQFR